MRPGEGEAEESREGKRKGNGTVGGERGAGKIRAGRGRGGERRRKEADAAGSGRDS